MHCVYFFVLKVYWCGHWYSNAASFKETYFDRYRLISSVSTSYCFYNSARERKGKESYDLMLCHLTGKPPDVAKWRVSFTSLSASNFSCFFFLWLLFSLHQSYFSVNSMLNYIHLQIEYNDQPNAELIIKSRKNADLVIRSIDFWNCLTQWPNGERDEFICFAST